MEKSWNRKVFLNFVATLKCKFKEQFVLMELYVIKAGCFFYIAEVLRCSYKRQ